MEEEVAAYESQPRSMDAEEASLTRWQLDPRETLENLSYSLRGFVKDSKSGDWVREDGTRPRINDKGVADIMSEVQHYINKDTPVSILTPEKINEMLKFFSLYFIDRMDARQEEFDIYDEDFPTVINDTVNSVEIFLRRAEKGKTLTGLQKITSVFSREGSGEEKEKKGFSIFGGAKGGK